MPQHGKPEEKGVTLKTSELSQSHKKVKALGFQLL